MSLLVLELFEVFETPHQIIVIGSNEEKTAFKIIKFAKWTLNEVTKKVDDWFLSVTEDEYLYSADDIRRTKCSLFSMTSANLILDNVYGIVGFFRFRQGYYMILITKRSLVAKLGQHKIYKVDDTKLIYLPGSVPSPWDSLAKGNESLKLPVTKHVDEKRYMALFNGVDLSIDYYFSYTYDLSNTVQYNLSYLSYINNSNNMISSISQSFINDRFVWNWSLWPPVLRPTLKSTSKTEFVMNFKNNWLIQLVHGFVGQTSLLAGAGCVEIGICLIARRSRNFAGTRFLKRGADLCGNVANEVETEQIVFEESGPTFEKSRVTSHVQLRGSIPLQWHQEMTKVVGKPPIRITREDAYYDTCARHFSDLLYRYGSPIIILNLVKQKEKHKFESPLSNKLVDAVSYLKSHFVDDVIQDQVIDYVEFDMARIQRSKNRTVLEKLDPVADNCIKKTSFFHSDELVRQMSHCKELQMIKSIQYGVVRTNCIDCLDRTNTAQFVIGQAAIGYQLFALGVIDCLEAARNPNMDHMLQMLYESHGNVLAMQYGGSELVHNIETYKKTAKLATQSRDLLQTVSRYLNNKFSDWDKQMSINLFLGIFKPWRSRFSESIWSHKYSDMYLHDMHCLTNNWNTDNNEPHYLYKALNIQPDHSSFWLPQSIFLVLPKPLNLFVKWNYLQLLDLNYKQYLSNVAIDESDGYSELSNKYLDRNVDENNEKLVHMTYHHFVSSRSYMLDVVDMTNEFVYLDNSLSNGNSSSTTNTTKMAYYSYSQLTKQKGESSSTESLVVGDVKNNLDPIKRLTGGPVMTALRNEINVDRKSISTESTPSDTSDEEDSVYSGHRKASYNPLRLDTTNSSINLLPKSKLLKFVINNYDDMFHDSTDCINSTANYFQVNHLNDISSMETMGDYTSSVESYQVSSFSQKLYEDTVKFGQLGSNSILVTDQNFYNRYCYVKDFSQLSTNYLLTHL